MAAESVEDGASIKDDVAMLIDKIERGRPEDEKLRAEILRLRARLAVLTGALNLIKEATDGVGGAEDVNLVARMALADAGLGFDGEL